MFVFFDDTPLQNTMAEQNVSRIKPPTITDEAGLYLRSNLTTGKATFFSTHKRFKRTSDLSDSQWTSRSSSSDKETPSKRKLPQKIRKGKPTFRLVDEDDEAQQESIPQEEGNDPDLELAKKMSLETHQEKGEGEGDDADMERAIKLSLDPAFLHTGGHLLVM
ncbi:hypothetical protein Tco_0475522 [Tanacetum coccineum]